VKTSTITGYKSFESLLLQAMRSPLCYRSKSSTITGTRLILCPSQIGEERVLDNVTGPARLKPRDWNRVYLRGLQSRRGVYRGVYGGSAEAGFYKVPKLKTRGGLVWVGIITDLELTAEVQREVEPLRVESFLAGKIAGCYEPLKSSGYRYG